MNHQPNTTEALDARELRRIRGLLRETANMAKEASLTGSLRDGGRASAQQYNAVLEYLERMGAVAAGLFRPLPDDASFDDVGIVAAQLTGYLVEDEAPPPPRRDRDGRHDQPKNVHVQIGNMPDLQELRGLGQKIREQVLEQVMRDRDQLISEWKSGWDPAAQSRSDQPPAPPVPPVPPAPPVPPGSITEQLLAVAAQLQKGDLSDAERAALAAQLTQLSQQPASSSQAQTDDALAEKAQANSKATQPLH